MIRNKFRLYEKRCLYCDKKFQSSRSDTKYCSHSCRALYSRHSREVKAILPDIELEDVGRLVAYIPENIDPPGFIDYRLGVFTFKFWSKEHHDYWMNNCDDEIYNMRSCWKLLHTDGNLYWYNSAPNSKSSVKDFKDYLARLRDRY